MEGQEDEIVILISDRRLQLNRITQELGNLGIGFDSPVNQHLKDEPPIRAVHSLLRIVRDKIQNRPDYVALWTLLTLLRGIGVRTIKAIADKCIENNQNFRELFDLPDLPDWFTQRETAALERARSVISRVQGWTLESSLNEKKEEISEILSSIIFSGSSNLVEVLSFWNVLKENLPQEITLEELSNYIAEDDENLQRKVLEKVKLRIDPAFQDENGVKKGIRILTMHGAKGLSGKIVFIPSMEQGILPKKKAMRATGLLNEQRRLAYVSITRAKAVCIMSHSASHTGAEAFQLANVWEARLPRSQFLTEMGVRSINRETGLTSDEARAIIADVNNL